MPEWQRVLAGIHYEMDRQAFSNVNNFVMAENVSTLAVATIKEHSLQLPGVEIVETSARSYDQSDIIPAVLGRVGKITAEKWKVTDSNGQVTYPLREKGYNMNDVLGISGLESVYEDELRGKDGVETITRNSDGVIVDYRLFRRRDPVALRSRPVAGTGGPGGDAAGLQRCGGVYRRGQSRRYDRRVAGGAGPYGCEPVERGRAVFRRRRAAADEPAPYRCAGCRGCAEGTGCGFCESDDRPDLRRSGFRRESVAT